MRAQTVVEQRWRLHACQKEPWTAAWLDELRPGDFLFNVGACVGSYALIAAHRGARVLAVEASPINVARLAENAVANRLGERISVVLAVCGPTSEPWGVQLRSMAAGAADIKIGEPHPDGIMLPGTTLDELAEVYGQPSHLLIDVDGAEANVLRGGTEALKRVRDVMIEMSRDPAISKACDGALAAAGLPLMQTWDKRGDVEIAGVTYRRHRRG